MKDKKIFVAGHSGMVGKAVNNGLAERGYTNILTCSRQEVDLRCQKSVDQYFNIEKPAVVILAAAKVGGIWANDQYPYPFLYDNLMIEANVINAAHQNNVQHLIFLGSSCIYPKLAPQPLKEEYLLTGALESTNQWYAIAKIAGIKLCEALNKQYGRNYITLMPTNLYGPNDNFDLKTSHVLPAMIRKFHEAKTNGHSAVTLWGSGDPKREFLHVTDLARAVIFVLEHDLKTSMYNVGSGTDLMIKQLASLIQRVTGHEGAIIWDKEKPDGTPRKLLDVSKINKEGWHHTIELEDGIRQTYKWYKEYINKSKRQLLHQY